MADEEPIEDEEREAWINERRRIRDMLDEWKMEQIREDRDDGRNED
jgi:hypothetical protein